MSHFPRFNSSKSILLTMFPSFLIFSGGTLLQAYSILICVRVMKARHLTAKSRWLWSLVIFICPLIGVFLYQAFREFVRSKEYKFFSPQFIERYLT